MSGRLAAIIVLTAAIGLASAGPSCAADAPAIFSKGALPPPDPIGNAEVQRQDYQIGPLDTLEIIIFPDVGLNRTLTVDGRGAIEFPLIGVVPAAGKTPAQLAADVGAALGAKYLQSPQVSVFVKQSVTQRFTVEGEVGSPGNYDLVGRMTLLQAIAAAHGVQDTALLSKVTIFRVVHQTTVATEVNLSDIRKGRAQDPEIYAGDKIVVGRSGALHVLHEMVALSPLLFFVPHP